jgi:hypothetical protein
MWVKNKFCSPIAFKLGSIFGYDSSKKPQMWVCVKQLEAHKKTQNKKVNFMCHRLYQG